MRVQIYLVLALLAFGLFWAHGHYGRRKPFANEIKDVLKVMLCLAALYRLGRDEDEERVFGSSAVPR